MCGIAGYIGFKNIPQENINRTLKIMQNRGPNNQQFISDSLDQNNIFLLHSRLSIIDLDERSNQPFEKDNLVIIFNGEIYNYLEIRKKLIKLGHNFTTNSDTEVIIEAYKRYSYRCVDYFEGMWAFVILDKKKKSFFFSRDRFGEKPLYLLELGNEIYFGSEIKFIFSLLGKSLDVNYQKISQFLICGFRSILKKETLFLGVRELPPSTNLVLRNNFIKLENKYWTLNFKPERISDSEIYES